MKNPIKNWLMRSKLSRHILELEISPVRKTAIGSIALKSQNRPRCLRTYRPPPYPKQISRLICAQILNRTPNRPPPQSSICLPGAIPSVTRIKILRCRLSCKIREAVRQTPEQMRPAAMPKISGGPAGPSNVVCKATVVSIFRSSSKFIIWPGASNRPPKARRHRGVKTRGLMRY